jgi:hypothetical protein
MRAAAAGRSLGRLLGKGKEMGSWGDGDRGGDAGASDSGPGWWAREGGEHVGQGVSATRGAFHGSNSYIPIPIPSSSSAGLRFSKGHGPQLY